MKFRLTANIKRLELEKFYQQQIHSWKLASENYAGLQHVAMKSLMIGSFPVYVQFNPKRIISSAARVDPKSIRERPCFLCSHNRPVEQTGIGFAGDYIILVNPYPIFHHHLTIPTLSHIPQRITGNFKAMLDLAEVLENYMIIYNGPQCGASAPDHFHFQAIPCGILPLETYIGSRPAVKTINDTGIFTWGDQCRNAVILHGKDPWAIREIFDRIFRYLQKSLPEADEPLLNLLVLKTKGSWQVFVFPRIRHRPSQYFETGDNQFLISPASIDMGGVLVVPRQDDFNRINADVVRDIYSQVCADDFFMQQMINELKR